MGLDKSTEGSRDRWPVQCCCACMQGGGNHTAESTAKKKKKKREQNPTAPQEGVRHKASGRQGNGTEQKDRRETAGGAKKK